MIEFIKKPNTDEEIFNVLNPIVKKWFKGKFGTFCLPQKYGIMSIHSRQNTLISAPTGSGKTLTAFLSILNELIDSSEKKILENKIYCIYVSPLKALNYDLEHNLLEPLKEMEEIAGHSFGIRIAVRTGDTTAYEKSKMLKNPPHILITTPESLGIILSSIRFIEHLKNVDWVIVDEVHALAENKRGVHLSISLERLQRLSSYITRVGLSATIAPIEEIASYLAGFENSKSRVCKVVDVMFIKKMDLKVLCPIPNLIEASHEEMHEAMYNLIDDLIQKHRTTLIFTNTRSATERVVDHLKDKFPKNYTENIGAHHGSLSKTLRRSLENRLRQGKLKVVVSSTSLELGIDIGYIDLVILLGSPKSVARAIQRIGRSGHKLSDISKGRIIVLDRDDMVECAVLLKSAIEKKIDRIHLPKNCLDVLAQQILGIAISENILVKEVFELVKRSYCFKELKYEDFKEIIEYLSGKYISLEDRHVYAKIWYDEETGMIGRKGKMTRVIYMTNIGTIPDETFVTVKIGEQTIGKLDEAFLERLHRGDVFVLGGDKYEFLYSKGTVAYVNASVHRPPTIPSWFSEMLPLSFDLANEISHFRYLMEEKLRLGKTKEDIVDFINTYLYVDMNTANSIYEYFREQFLYASIPTEKKIVIETYVSEGKKYFIFHALFGRRVNDALSRALAYIISRSEHHDIEVGINDNGFYFASQKKMDVKKALKLLKAEKLDLLLNMAIEHTEVLKRRFRHCATRALMILRNYKGHQKRVGRQQVSSMILMTAVKRISNEFPILKEARREVLEDLMDIDNAKLVLKKIESKNMSITHISTTIPSPFAFSLILQGYVDLLKMGDKVEFIRRMHQMVLAKIALKK